ncbi:MAG: ParB/RepB/Spo0J family partition protein, partial [Desulfosarcinaceae bacterium]
MYEPVRELPIAQIDEEDTTYRISSPGDIQKLASSLQAIGLINPPILEQVKAKCRIVCGFKRIQAARLLNWTAVPARVLPPQSSPRKCTQIAVADNSVTRNLGIVEQARALKLLERFIDGDEALIEAGQKINLPLNQAMIEKLRLVNEMKPVLQNGLVTGAISLPIAIRLHRWQDYPAMEVTGRLMNALNMSLNRQREMLNWFKGILSREKTTLHEIFESLDIE